MFVCWWRLSGIHPKEMSILKGCDVASKFDPTRWLARHKGRQLQFKQHDPQWQHQSEDYKNDPSYHLVAPDWYSTFHCFLTWESWKNEHVLHCSLPKKKLPSFQPNTPGAQPFPQAKYQVDLVDPCAPFLWIPGRGWAHGPILKVIKYTGFFGKCVVAFIGRWQL